MSTNPYAQAPAGPAVSAASPEQQQRFDYELAIGRNNDYYVPRFEELDAGGSRASWHWPAFFVTSWWYLYRKMYGVGVLCLFLPFIALIIAGIVYGIFEPSAWVFGLITLVLVTAPKFLLSIFANTLYWRHVRKVIRAVPQTIASQPDKRAARIERNGGTAVGPMIGIMAAVGFFGIGILGILAAIAIPAYQDYTIRAQVAEGLNLAKPIQGRVEDIWISEHRWAEQGDLPGETPIGQYVDKVEVSTGSIVITFGGQANANIHGQRIAITPITNEDGDIQWSCGNAATPTGWTPSDGYAGSDVPDKYLPAKCRSGS